MKKSLLISLLLFAIALSLVSCNGGTYKSSPVTTDTVTAEGRVVVGEGSYIIVEDDGPISMENAGEADMFAGLTTGDLIRIVRDDEIRESYPAQVRVYSCEKLSDGGEGDVDANVLSSLRELGWVKENFESESGTTIDQDLGIMLPYETAPGGYVHESAATELVSYEYGHANMSIRVPEGWKYTVSEYSKDCGSFGITVYPEYKPSESITLMYYPDMFGVCGTELTEVDTTLSGLPAKKGYYGSSQIWSFIAVDDYALLNRMSDGTFQLYRDDIELMIDSVTVADGIITKSDAIKKALREADANIDESLAVARFDHVEGVWRIKLYTDKSYSSYSRYVEIDYRGNVVAFALVD